MLDKNETIQKIETLVSDLKIGYLEAILYYCDKYSIEIESIAPLIKRDSDFKWKLFYECEKLNLVEKQKNLESLFK